MLVTRLTPVLIGLLLAGCSGMHSTPSPDPAPPPPRVEAGGECGAEGVDSRVGHTYSEALDEKLRAESGAAAMRVIRPGDAVTLDHRPERLNVRLDEADTITALNCG
ncbi:MAG: hypothetical protein HLX48_03850 [Halomonas sp.]|uniref:I78 family peptidase inhibitor n=1 Tax=Halomonas sp. TaxID=1486246 RepID=UPI0017D23C99|nr:I78 family peptidase inhibitor [Halomonas sp.]NWN82119.1 hypothetical protein [Halomonas sp.]